MSQNTKENAKSKASSFHRCVFPRKISETEYISNSFEFGALFIFRASISQSNTIPGNK